jgi:hypothetical protein
MSRTLRLIAFNIVLTLLIAEVALRIIGPRLPGQVGVALRYVTTGSPYDQQWSPAWQQNRDHYYALKPGLTDSLQYGSPGVQFRLTTRELWEGGGIGFRAPVVDFFVDGVVVGDSFGLCFTEQADCWVDQLQGLTGRRFVNLSQPVTGTRSHLRILQDFGAPLKPPLVIWQFFGNDFNDDYGLAVFRDEIEPVEAEAAPPEPADAAMWLRRSSALFAAVETALTGRYLGLPSSEALFAKPYTIRYGPNNEHTLMLGGQYELQALDMSREANQIGYEMSRQAFAAAQSLVAGWGGQMIVVIIPTREEVYSPLAAPALGQDHIQRLQSARDAMLDLCSALALVCYDAYEALQPRAALGEALYHADDMHLNATGNQALAEWLAERLPPPAP